MHPEIIYLDVSCLNRPFDDQGQPRIRLESEAIALILERIDNKQLLQVSSDIADLEIKATADGNRRSRVRALLPRPENIGRLKPSTFGRARTLVKLGFKAADALHLAAAEEWKASAFLTCDDRLLKLARRCRTQLQVVVVNPLDWIEDHPDVTYPRPDSTPGT